MAEPGADTAAGGVDPFLLEILVCPDNHDPLSVADDELIARINQLIDDKALRNRGGALVDARADAALVRKDRAYAYLVRDGIPVMLIDEAIALADLS